MPTMPPCTKPCCWGQLVAHWYLDVDAPGLDAREARADQAHRRLARERVAHAGFEIRIGQRTGHGDLAAASQMPASVVDVNVNVNVNAVPAI